jgi:hypothetical protein
LFTQRLTEQQQPPTITAEATWSSASLRGIAAKLLPNMLCKVMGLVVSTESRKVHRLLFYFSDFKVRERAEQWVDLSDFSSLTTGACFLLTSS